MELLSPQQVIDASLAAFQTVQLDQPVQVSVAVPNGLPELMADSDALVEVFLNLLSNARKYGGTQIKIDAHADRGGVVISVTDNGPGIPVAERKRIFEKFYRPDLLQTRRAEGSGLGLAIVKAIVQAHNGRVTVESAPGKGARFAVWLPRA
jgi:two-component system phosphate regulon sensor histidine kinase PhoR